MKDRGTRGQGASKEEFEIRVIEQDVATSTMFVDPKAFGGARPQILRRLWQANGSVICVEQLAIDAEAAALLEPQLDQTAQNYSVTHSEVLRPLMSRTIWEVRTVFDDHPACQYFGLGADKLICWRRSSYNMEQHLMECSDQIIEIYCSSVANMPAFAT